MNNDFKEMMLLTNYALIDHLLILIDSLFIQVNKLYLQS